MPSGFGRNAVIGRWPRRQECCERVHSLHRSEASRGLFQGRPFPQERQWAVSGPPAGLAKQPVTPAVSPMIRPAGAAPLGTIRSLAYFSPVIEEVIQMQVSTEYFHYLRHKLQRAALAQ